MNLYMVLDSNYDWCCFAFDTSRNKAKLSVAREFGNEYTEMRCKTLKKGVNVPAPMLAPLTRAEELRQKLTNLTGEVYLQLPNEYCAMCGERLNKK